MPKTPRYKPGEQPPEGTFINTDNPNETFFIKGEVLTLKKYSGVTTSGLTAVVAEKDNVIDFTIEDVKDPPKKDE